MTGDIGDIGNWAPVLTTLWRVVIGLLFVYHGFLKIQTEDQVVEWFESIKLPFPKLQARLAAYGELLGGLAVAIGLGGVAGPALLAIIMAAAIKIAHWVRTPNGQNGGWEYPAVLLLSNLTLATTGFGQWSADAALQANWPQIFLFWQQLFPTSQLGA